MNTDRTVGSYLHVLVIGTEGKGFGGGLDLTYTYRPRPGMSARPNFFYQLFDNRTMTGHNVVDEIDKLQDTTLGGFFETYINFYESKKITGV